MFPSNNEVCLDYSLTWVLLIDWISSQTLQLHFTLSPCPSLSTNEQKNFFVSRHSNCISLLNEEHPNPVPEPKSALEFFLRLGRRGWISNALSNLQGVCIEIDRYHEGDPSVAHFYSMGLLLHRLESVKRPEWRQGSCVEQFHESGLSTTYWEHLTQCENDSERDSSYGFLTDSTHPQELLLDGLQAAPRFPHHLWESGCYAGSVDCENQSRRRDSRTSQRSDSAKIRRFPETRKRSYSIEEYRRLSYGSDHDSHRLQQRNNGAWRHAL